MMCQVLAALGYLPPQIALYAVYCTRQDMPGVEAAPRRMSSRAQSWTAALSRDLLLREYPDTPRMQMPQVHSWGSEQR
jgi:hypothetical protein